MGAGGFGGARSPEGFSDQLAAIERQTIPALHLVKLGCGGESTSSMIAESAELPGQTEHTVGLCNYSTDRSWTTQLRSLSVIPGRSPSSRSVLARMM